MCRKNYCLFAKEATVNMSGSKGPIGQYSVGRQVSRSAHGGCAVLIQGRLTEQCLRLPPMGQRAIQKLFGRCSLQRAIEQIVGNCSLRACESCRALISTSSAEPRAWLNYCVAARAFGLTIGCIKPLDEHVAFIKQLNKRIAAFGH